MVKAPTRPLGNIYFITIHHAAGRGARDLTELRAHAASYDNYHKYQGWTTETKGEHGYSYLAYHYMIGRDGSLIQTQDIKYVRNHAADTARKQASHNLHGIGILIDGDFERGEVPTLAQLNAAASLIKKLQFKLSRQLVIKGHRETSLTGTSCPGKNIGLSTDPKSNLSRIIRSAQVVNPVSNLINFIIALLKRIFTK